SHQAVGLAAGMTTLEALARDAAVIAGLDPTRRPLAAVGAMCLSGADSPADIRRLSAAIAALGLIAAPLDVRNDTEAPLRAGTDGWGGAVVCGAGINAIARAPDGRVARFAGLGAISGDSGGGGAVGL